VILTELASRTHIKRRHYDEENILPNVRYQLEQQRRRQNDGDKWNSIYNILFPGEPVPNPCMHVHRSVTVSIPSPNVVGTVVFIDSSSPSQRDSRDVSQSSSTHLSAALEESTPSGSTTADLDENQENMTAELIVRDVRETSSIFDVSLPEADGFGPDDLGLFDSLELISDILLCEFELDIPNS
jgi:hypothetical protein